MKFSVVIPVYNVERYLSSCIDSVLAQKYKDYEVILVDDGATDSSGAICDKYGVLDERIRIIHQENYGISVARNTGIINSKGDYIVFLDSDDFVLRDDFLNVLSYKCDGEVDVVQYGYDKYYEGLEKFVSGEIPPDMERQSLTEMLTQVLRSNSFGGCAWTKAVKRSLLVNNDIYFKPGMVALEDTDWFLNLLCYASSYTCINDVFIAYRQRCDSVSHSPKIESMINSIWILNTWTQKIKDCFQEKGILNLFNGVLAYYYSNALILYTFFTQRERKSYRETLISYSFLLKDAITPRAIVIKKVYSFLGFDFTIFLLKILRLIK